MEYYVEYISECASEYVLNLKNYLVYMFYNQDEDMTIVHRNDIIKNYKPSSKKIFKDIESEIRKKKFEEEYLELEKRFNKLKEEIKYDVDDDDDKNYPDDALTCKVKTKKLLI